MNHIDRDTLGMYKSYKNSSGPGPELMGAGTLIGDDVYNHNEEDLGDIKEIMLDMRTGEVAYAVLSFGGILGMGEKLFAVPWQSLTLDTINKRFLLDVGKEHLKNAPGFDKDNWPDMSSADWTREVDRFYGASSLSGGRSMQGSRAQQGRSAAQGSSMQSGGSAGQQGGNLSDSGSASGSSSNPGSSGGATSSGGGRTGGTGGTGGTRS